MQAKKLSTDHAKLMNKSKLIRERSRDFADGPRLPALPRVLVRQHIGYRYRIRRLARTRASSIQRLPSRDVRGGSASTSGGDPKPGRRSGSHAGSDDGTDERSVRSLYHPQLLIGARLAHRRAMPKEVRAA
jgi:hypothetical protein